MKIQFYDDLKFQHDAIKSITDIFKSKNPIHLESIISDTGSIANHLSSTKNEIIDNIKTIQHKNNIVQPNTSFEMNFSIEMETGTGKTYVYLRTIFELYKLHNFKKFIIVVPSVAIREGVLKNLDITRDHFMKLYGNVQYNYYEYNSNKLNRIKQFVRHNQIEILVMTIDSFNKDTNLLNRHSDAMGLETPINLIKKIKPILILDEPQNMESDNARQAIDSLSPLFTLRYSATHRKYYNLIYRLLPLDAQEQNLVKHISLKEVIKDGDFNRAYIECDDIIATHTTIKAILVVHKKLNNGYKKVRITVKKDYDLSKKTNNIQYDGFIVSGIDTQYNIIKFSNGIEIIKGGKFGNDRKDIMNAQIRESIDEHFLKVKELKPLGIKPLTLFFIDKVDNYIKENGHIRVFFNNCLKDYIKRHPEFKHLDKDIIHAGYFAQTRHANRYVPKDSSTGQSIDDKKVYDLIMKDKEKLLSFDEPIQFIFSHSALREGWDNPNVFNICTLNETISDIKKRQEIGRGMRLPVNQDGKRVSGIHHLTIIANEYYEDYVNKLNEEYGNIAMPTIHNVKDRKLIKLKHNYKLNSDFINLWNLISQKTKYLVTFDSEKLIKNCINEINNSLEIQNITISVNRASFVWTEDGILAKKHGFDEKTINVNLNIPNIIKQLSNETNLTYSTITKILLNINNLELIFKNPQSFIISVGTLINKNLKELLSDGIKYVKSDERYEMKLFENITTFNKNNPLTVKKSIYEKIIWESNTERDFAKQLETYDRIKMFIKLPNWFLVYTPIGNYNPDWAILLNDNNQSKNTLYFVAETKSTLDDQQLRPSELKKIQYAKKHFNIIGIPYAKVITVDDVYRALSKTHD